MLIASPIDPRAMEKLGEHHHIVCALDASPAELQKRIRNCEVLVFRSGVNISAQVLENAPNMKLLIRAGSGLDNLDIEDANRRGIKLVRIPEPAATAVAEMSFAMMLALSRNLIEADRLTRQGRWAKNELSGYLLSNKVLGIIGTGNIGSRVGQMGNAWGMNVIGCNDIKSLELADALKAKGIRLTDFDEVVASADYLSIHVPLTETTRHMIGSDVLARMKPGSFLINLARGGVVDENALYKALIGGRSLCGAALDVHEAEGEGKISSLAGLPNVILTPHIGSMTYDTQREIGLRIIEIVNSFNSNPTPVVGNQLDDKGP